MESARDASEPGSRPIHSGAADLWAAQLIRRGSRLLFLTIAARALRPANFGIYVLLLTLTEMAALMAGAGFGDFVTRELAQNSSEAYNVCLRVTQLRFVYSCFLTALMLVVLYLINYPSAVLAWAGILGATLIPRAVLETSQGALRAFEHFRSIMLLELLQAVVFVGLGVLLFFRGLGMTAAVAAELGGVTVAALAAAITWRRLCPAPVRRYAQWSQLVRRTLPFNFYPLVVQIYDRVDVVLLAKLAGNVAVGLYSLPYKLYASLQIFPYAFFGSALPAFTKLQWGTEMRQASRRVMGFFYAAALCVVLLTSLLATPSINLLMGSEYAGSSIAFKILIWATVPMCLNYALNTILLVTHREKVFFLTATICVIVNVSANVLLIPHYSYKAAAFVTLLTELVLLAQNVYWTRRLLGEVIVPDRIFLTTALFIVSGLASLVTTRYLSAIAVAFGVSLMFAAYYVVAWRTDIPSGALRR